LKGASSHWVNHIEKPQKNFKWQDGYSAFSVSKEIMHRVIAYIENQERHHQEGTLERDWEFYD
jgi:putative transposase